MFYDLLSKYKFPFDRTLGTCKAKPIEMELYLGAKPYHSKPYPGHRAQDAVFCKEVERLCQLGVPKM